MFVRIATPFTSRVREVNEAERQWRLTVLLDTGQLLIPIVREVNEAERQWRPLHPSLWFRDTYVREVNEAERQWRLP